MLCSSLLCLALLGAAPAGEPEALLMIQQREPRLIDERHELFDDKEYSRFRRTQAVLVKTYLVLNSAIRNPEISQLPSLKAQGDGAIAWLQENLVVELPNDSEIMRLKFKEGSPKERSKLINAIAGAYIEEIINRARANRLDEQETLRATYNDYSRRESELLRKANNLAKELGADASNRLSRVATASFEEQFAKINDRLLQIDVRLAVLEQRAARAGTSTNDTATKSTEAAEKDTDSESSGTSDSTTDPRQTIADLKIERGVYHRRLQELEKRLSRLDQFSTDYEEAKTDLERIRRLLPRISQQLMIGDIDLKARDRVSIIQEAKP